MLQKLLTSDDLPERRAVLLDNGEENKILYPLGKP